ncbi:hypothetical protein K3152_06135 [Qipengyuania sp. 1NDH17]|uniref:Serine kinase n=1 Tax=Qipengyuania polymorpha TaxID=2867234 RepID=A0ABS7IWB5_9SPHN|nr:hypothetical protein [Qipengyuania polymorpha]MBX7457819.1 hypothetical protein [Qipengyuania polymorpha]
MSDLKSIFQVYYEREYEHRDNTELVIGFYKSREEAEQVVSKLVSKPGFKDYPEGFEIDEIRFGLAAGWEEGFYSEVGPPPKDAEAEYFDLPYWTSQPKKQETK